VRVYGFRHFARKPFTRRTAFSSYLKLVFNDTPARPGETLMLNFVQMKPYYE